MKRHQKEGVLLSPAIKMHKRMLSRSRSSDDNLSAAFAVWQVYGNQDENQNQDQDENLRPQNQNDNPRPEDQVGSQYSERYGPAAVLQEQGLVNNNNDEVEQNDSGLPANVVCMGARERYNMYPPVDSYLASTQVMNSLFPDRMTYSDWVLKHGNDQIKVSPLALADAFTPNRVNNLRPPTEPKKQRHDENRRRQDGAGPATSNCLLAHQTQDWSGASQGGNAAQNQNVPANKQRHENRRQDGGRPTTSTSHMNKLRPTEPNCFLARSQPESLGQDSSGASQGGNSALLNQNVPTSKQRHENRRHDGPRPSTSSQMNTVRAATEPNCSLARSQQDSIGQYSNASQDSSGACHGGNAAQNQNVPANKQRHENRQDGGRPTTSTIEKNTLGLMEPNCFLTRIWQDSLGQDLSGASDSGNAASNQYFTANKQRHENRRHDGPPPSTSTSQKNTRRAGPSMAQIRLERVRVWLRQQQFNCEQDSSAATSSNLQTLDDDAFDQNVAEFQRESRHDQESQQGRHHDDRAAGPSAESRPSQTWNLQLVTKKDLNENMTFLKQGSKFCVIHHK